jgi:hypothetical protein
MAELSLLDQLFDEDEPDLPVPERRSEEGGEGDADDNSDNNEEVSDAEEEGEEEEEEEDDEEEEDEDAGENSATSKYPGALGGGIPSRQSFGGWDPMFDGSDYGSDFQNDCGCV